MPSQHLLFRQEVIDFQQHHRQWGQIALLQPLSTKILTWFIATAVSLVVAFDGRDPFGELDALVLGYATTIHKRQGSEYPAVVIALVTQHYMMLARNLLYTGVTRGKRLVVSVGQRRAIAVRNRRSGRRWAKLRDHLAGAWNSS